MLYEEKGKYTRERLFSRLHIYELFFYIPLFPIIPPILVHLPYPPLLTSICVEIFAILGVFQENLPAQILVYTFLQQHRQDPLVPHDDEGYKQREEHPHPNFQHIGGVCHAERRRMFE